MSMFGYDWDNGKQIASFKCDTNGPEYRWEVVMRICDSGDGSKSRVVLDPFGDRLMWFDDDNAGKVASNRAFCDLVSLAMCDADVRRSGL